MTVAHKWPFQAGERVRCTGAWGPLVTDLTVHSGKHPDAVYTIEAVSDGGRWLLLRDEDGNLYPRRGIVGGAPMPTYGPSYFRIVGGCGVHRPTYSYEIEGWLCARCDKPLPEYARPYPAGVAHA